MTTAQAISVQVPLDDATAVRTFFKAYGAGAGARGFYLPFIAKECGLTATQTMAALCALIELGEVEMSMGLNNWTWTFWPKGGRLG